MPWLPCQFIDDRFEINEDGHRETKHHHRDAGLQFGQVGDSPVHSELITFLITGEGYLTSSFNVLMLRGYKLTTISLLISASKVDMRRYVKDDVDTLQCEVRRHSTDGIVMRWPGLGAQEHDVWFTCTLRHTEGQFAITTFLRHTPNDPSAKQPGSESEQRINIADRDTVSTTGMLYTLHNTENIVNNCLHNNTRFSLPFLFSFCGQL